MTICDECGFASEVLGRRTKKAHADTCSRAHPPKTYTAENVTDEEILDLNDSKDPTRSKASLTTKAWCLAAMRVAHTPKQHRERMKARARVAEILNARGGK